MDRKERCVFTIQQNIFRPIAVVHIKIVNRHPSGSRGQCLERGNGDVVEITEAHRPMPRRVVPRRSHQTENLLPVAGASKCFERGADRGSGMIVDPWVVRRVSVEIPGDLESGDHLRCVRAQDGFFACWSGFGPGDGEIRL